MANIKAKVRNNKEIVAKTVKIASAIHVNLATNRNLLVAIE